MDACTSLDKIARAFGLQAEPKPVTGFSMDSRSLQAGELFLPFEGPHFDGHDFAALALSRGAVGVLSYKPAPKGFEKSWYQAQSPSSLSLIRSLASWWRQQHLIPFLAIGGSVGKTSTKALIEAYVKRTNIHALVTAGSENGFLGISKTLLGLRSHHQVAIIEVGIDAPGAMQAHIELIRPELALLTAITEEHLEKLQDLETIFKEQALLLKSVSSAGGRILIQEEDPWIRTLSSLPGAFCVGPKAKDFRWNQPLGTFENDQTREFLVPGLAPQLYPNLGLAIAASHLLGVPKSALSQPLEAFQLPGPRARIENWGDRVLLVDYYNAQPASMRGALQWLRLQPQQKKIAVLGDMLELGENSQALHQALLPELEGLDVALVGGDEGMGSLKNHFPHFSDPKELTEWVQARFQSNTALLLKASRGLKLERIHEALFPSYQAPIWPISEEGMQRAVDALKMEALIGLPTETVYGLAALASSQTAVKQVFAVKKRPHSSPLILHIHPDWGTLDVLREKGWISTTGLSPSLCDKIERLIKKAWPGPLTVLFPVGPKCHPEITALTPWIGIRVPAQTVAQKLLFMLGEPLVAPSANLFGHISPTSALDVVQELHHPALRGVLDGGECAIGMESTVVKPREEDFLVLRPGACTKEHFDAFGIRTHWEIPHATTVSPGMEAGHYAPHKPLRPWNGEESTTDQDEGLLIWHEAQRPTSGSWKNIRVIAPSGTPEDMIRFFFKHLRALDEGDCQSISIADVPKEAGLFGPTLTDRLRKAIKGSGKGTR